MKNHRLLLRKKSTISERIVWKILRDNHMGFKFKRQYSIGPYVADFFSSKRKLVIEIDGLQHQKADNKNYDKFRTRYFNALGLKVIRVSNDEIIKNPSRIINLVQPPSPEAGEGRGEV